MCIFFFQAEDGIRDLVRSRGLGDVYKRQAKGNNSSIRRWANGPDCPFVSIRKHDAFVVLI